MDKETDLYENISSTKELDGGTIRVDPKNGELYVDMPDGRVFNLIGGIYSSDLYGKFGFVDARRVK